MALAKLDHAAFVERLNAAVSPSRPIDSIEHLQGRSRELVELERALEIAGRHVFIYGDRGVGKSSLAATLATQMQSSGANPISVAGSPTETFSSMVLNIVARLSGQTRTRQRTTTKEYGAGISSGLSLAGKRSECETESLFARDAISISDAAELIAETVEAYSKSTVVVIDEFDRISDAAERQKFADLLKHLGDARTPIRIVFTGVGRSLTELLGAHGSAIRQLHTKELERLSYDGRWDIARKVAAAFDLELPRELEIRIAAISDGYPYYVHLMMEKMLWRAFDEDEDVTKISERLYINGLRDAINSINAELRQPYELVLQQRTRDYEPVLWATADGDELYSDMWGYLASYRSIMKQLDQDPLSDQTFRRRIKSLMSESMGPILTRDPYINRQFMYAEKMFRGYVRMQAEAHDIQLYGREAKADRQTMHIPASVRTGFRGPSVPEGVKFKGERKKRRRR